MNAEIFHTEGMDATTLQHAALLLSQAWGEGRAASADGPYAQQLSIMAGANLQGVSPTDPQSAYARALSTLAPAVVGGPAALLPAATVAAVSAANDAPTAATKWLASHAANWTFIAIGSVLVVATLVISQRKPIGKAVALGKKVVEKAGEIAVLAA